MRTRTAYIRTLIDKEAESDYNETGWGNLKTWLGFWVGQRVHPDPCGQGKRKDSAQPADLRFHYILGHTTASDDYALDWLIEQSRPDSWRLSRDDFTVYLSQAQADDAATGPLLERLQREGVAVELIPAPKDTQTTTPVEYPSDDACDSAMLSASDYVLETYILRRHPTWPLFDAYYRDSMRHGRTQQFNTKELGERFHADRLARKTGHTLQQGLYLYPKSDEWKRRHAEAWRNYKCPACGLRCKRSKGCRTTGEQWWTHDRAREHCNWAEGVDTSAPRPPEFERVWRTLSAEDVVHGFGPDEVASARFRNWKWASVATFSGE